MNIVLQGLFLLASMVAMGFCFSLGFSAYEQFIKLCKKAFSKKKNYIPKQPK